MAKAPAAGKNEGQEVPAESRGECFVIMPISDPDGYSPGHFARVYEDIFKPAIRRAGYEPKRADDVLETNLIQLDLLRRLLEAPMAICDLSSRNPNVLFELGLRQAFDKPVAIVQEEGTPKIFDIAPLRFTQYRRARVYHEVIADQAAIARAIDATREAGSDKGSVNSLVRLLGLAQPATIAELSEADRDPVLQLIRAELAELRQEFRATRASDSAKPGRGKPHVGTIKFGTPYRLVYLDLNPASSSTNEFFALLRRELGWVVSWSKTSGDDMIAALYPVVAKVPNAVADEELWQAISAVAADLQLAEAPLVWQSGEPVGE